MCVDPFSIPITLFCCHGNTEPPFITRCTLDTLAIQGTYIILPCEATSYQDTPTIQWSFNGLPLVPSPRWKVLSDQSLLLTALNLSDTGTYSCMASNHYGASVANVTVWVLSKLRISLLKCSICYPCSGIPINVSTTAVVGSGVQLPCNITGTVVWKKNGDPVMTSSRVVIGPQQKLYILSVQLGDEGEYGCDGGGRWMNTFLQVTGEGEITEEPLNTFIQ